MSKMYLDSGDLWNILFRLQRGLTGYISYLATCDVNTTFSEYLLYESMFRILATQGFRTTCEFAKETKKRKGKLGDKKRIDFYAEKDTLKIAIEVKWPRSKVTKWRVGKDRNKLKEFDSSVEKILIVFGRWNHLKDRKRQPPDGFFELLKPLYGLFKQTQFGCHVYKLV